MNYRHAFHAGNFADLVKHAALLLFIRGLQAAGPLSVIDTHAGRGVYDLAGDDARRSGEAEAGVMRLMAARQGVPQGFAPLIAAVRALNGGAGLRRYPGSPWLAAQSLRPNDRYLGCELRPEEHAALRRALEGRPGVRTLCADGYKVAAKETPAAGQVLLLIDPPFERADDYLQIVDTLGAVRARNRAAAALVWLPLKDLETFDRFLRDFEEALDAPALVAETRMRPLNDPMKMNGCALLLLGAPPSMQGELEAVCDWTAANLGEGGGARIRRI